MLVGKSAFTGTEETDFLSQRTGKNFGRVIARQMKVFEVLFLLFDRFGRRRFCKPVRTKTYDCRLAIVTVTKKIESFTYLNGESSNARGSVVDSFVGRSSLLLFREWTRCYARLNNDSVHEKHKQSNSS